MRDFPLSSAALSAILLAATCMLHSCQAAAQTVIVVRHGEKLDASPDPILSPQGDARAARLADMLAASRITTIYTTQYKRTVLLAAPTAKRMGVTPTVVDGKDTETLLAKIRAHAKDDVVLVVGHSNTVPAIIKGLGHSAPIVVREDEFDNLFIVAMKAKDVPTVVNLKY
ncbi:MAG: phosphoglycerate mutase family protein [Usitatibacteraceae bacterium]